MQATDREVERRSLLATTPNSEEISISSWLCATEQSKLRSYEIPKQDYLTVWSRNLKRTQHSGLRNLPTFFFASQASGPSIVRLVSVSTQEKSGIRIIRARGPSDGFTPSRELVEIVRLNLEEIARERGIDVNIPDPVEKLRIATVGLFASMANSILLDSKPNDFQISRSGQFIRAVSEAIYSSLPVNFSQISDFLSRLHKELIAAAELGQIEGTRWRLVSKDGDLWIAIEPPEQEVTGASESIKRATVRSLGALRHG